MGVRGLCPSAARRNMCTSARFQARLRRAGQAPPGASSALRRLDAAVSDCRCRGTVPGTACPNPSSQIQAAFDTVFINGGFHACAKCDCHARRRGSIFGCSERRLSSKYFAPSDSVISSVPHTSQACKLNQVYPHTLRESDRALRSMSMPRLRAAGIGAVRAGVLAWTADRLIDADAHARVVLESRGLALRSAVRHNQAESALLSPLSPIYSSSAS
jgi:hypothetical protein